MGKSNWKDMREYLDFLEGKGEAIHIKEEVDPEWEINGITRMVLQQLGPAVIFDRIKGCDLPLVTGMLASDKRFLWALGLEEWSQFNEQWAERTRQLIPTKVVEKGVCQEETMPVGEMDINRMCNVKWHEQDGGLYSGTMSISITKDPDTGIQNAGIYRLANLSKNRLGWGVSPYNHGRLHYRKYERLGKPMPMAVVTGNDPITCIVASTPTALGVDEFQLAGALRGEPLETVKCKTIDIEVPTNSEMVFEGVIYPDVRQTEGGFGEYTGYYGEARDNPVFEIQAVTHRKNPVFLGTREQWYPSESMFVTGRTGQAELYKSLKALVPGILDIRCDLLFEAVVKIDKQFAGHPQKVMDAVFGLGRFKHVIVVDEDIDIWDYNSVHWALSTRVRADRDVCITPRRIGQWLDPSTPLKARAHQTLLGIDATLPGEEYDFYGEPVPITVEDREIVNRVKAKWGDRLGIK